MEFNLFTDGGLTKVSRERLRQTDTGARRGAPASVHHSQL